jgi:hypothetical protein
MLELGDHAALAQLRIGRRLGEVVDRSHARDSAKPRYPIQPAPERGRSAASRLRATAIAH